MDWLWYILISLVSGTFAGMGMGGGTFLIPLLILFMKTAQTQAQAQNLVVFIPMAIIVGIIYTCQHLVDWRRAWIIALPATAVAVLGSLLAVHIAGPVLRIIFGAFIAGVGVWQLVVIIVKMIRKKKNRTVTIGSPTIKTIK